MLQAAPIRVVAVSLACVLAASCTAQVDSPKTPAKAASNVVAHARGAGEVSPREADEGAAG
jgi:hypothetical protein